MKIQLQLKELKNALTGLLKVVPRKATLPVLRGLRIEAAGRTVRFTATGLEATVTYTFDAAQVIEPGLEILADARQLKEALAQAARGDIELRAQRGSIQLTHGEQSEQLPTLDPVGWPDALMKVTTGATETPFTELYRSLVPFGSKDPSRAILGGVCIDANESAHNLVATDGRRLSAFNSIHLPINKTCVVPSHKFLCWSKLDGACLVGVSGSGYFRLETGPWAFTCKTIEGTYPNWRQAVPAAAGANGIELLEEDIPALEEAIKVLPEDHAKAVTLLPKQRGLCLAAHDRESGKWSYCDLPHSKAHGKPVTVNRAYLHDAVRAGFRNFRWQDERSPLVSRTDTGLHVLMPLQAEAPPGPKPTNPQPKEQSMPKQNNGSSDPNPDPATSVEQLVLSFQAVREQVRDLNAALGELGDQIRAVKKNDRAVKSELNNARGVLNKLQSMQI